MLIIEESDGATIEFRYVDLTNAGSTTNSVFEVGFADPTDSNNTVRIPDSNGDPSASELLSGKSGGSTGIWAYSVADSGSPSPHQHRHQPPLRSTPFSRILRGAWIASINAPCH